jgi:acetylornithine/N-succinyldiaminopimelate aminotransferase
MAAPAVRVHRANPPSPATPAVVYAAVAAGRDVRDAVLGTYKRPPMDIVRGEGVYLIDADGKRYLDFVSGIAVNALGYSDAGLANTLRTAADGLLHVSNLYWTAPAARLADALVRRSFASRAFFCNSGAEANEAAFKFARRWARMTGEGKTDIIALRGSFHGRLFASLAATDRPTYRMPFRPLAGGVRIVERDLRDIASAMDAETTAALILEPIQGEGGVRVLDADFVRTIREMTRERHVALIFDEVQCGLGRTGTLFAYEQFDAEPDLLTLAKPIAAGLPMGAVLLRDEIARAIQPGDHGTTFGGGPFVATVAEYVLERVGDPSLLAAVRQNGAWFGAQLRDIASRTDRIRAVRGLGYMWGIDVTRAASAVVADALSAGLLVCGAGEHTVRLLPPLVATRDDLAQGLTVLEQVL